MKKIKLILKIIWFILKSLFVKIAQLFNRIPKKIIKKVFAVVLVFVISIVAIGSITAIIDGIRFKNEKEPIFVIKTVSKSPLKVTYKGLGYKVVRIPMVTELEPYRNYADAKFGSWFMDFEPEEVIPNHTLLEIVDRTTEEDFQVEDGAETFFEDKDYYYQFPCKKGIYVLVHFRDGQQLSVREALKKGDITITDLDKWKIDYIKTKK